MKDEAYLVQACEDGLHIDTVCAHLGRTRAAVYCRCSFLELSGITRSTKYHRWDKEDERIMLMLLAEGDWTADEIGEKIGVTGDAVRGRLRQMKKEKARDCKSLPA
ncbi:hypothetical protein vBSlqSZDD2_27 [Serratia phage vB_SlqS_ZDD2]|nr:hypothetical protein vBSlqSZDD2_27 [Serratia phage vB_SlqS_ZDD2]